jgi:type I restriction enzyme S subunit
MRHSLPTTRQWTGIVREIEIPLPPLPEQHRIVAKIEELFSSLDKGIETLKTTQVQLKVYRQAVLKWAFEGMLVPQDPNDLPASVLLARIKAERGRNKAEAPKLSRKGRMRTRKAQS